MTYLEWFNAHAKKHKHILQKLQKRTDEEVIAYFRWENMVEKEPDFCPLFARKEKCHDMERLNCYLCACPEFRFDDQAPKYKSWCTIEARNSRKIEFKNAVHLDCSGCILPHTEGYIKKHFDRNWRKIMHKVLPKG
jgi:hypothetical protein